MAGGARMATGACSGGHELEDQCAFDHAGEVGVDGVEAGDAVDERGGADEVGALEKFQPRLLEFQARGVERAGLVGDQDDALELVDLNEELELVNNPLLFQMRLRVAGEAGGAAGESDSVAAREVQTVAQKVVEVLAEAAIGAVDGRGVDAGGFVADWAWVVWHRRENMAVGEGDGEETGRRNQGAEGRVSLRTR